MEKHTKMSDQVEIDLLDLLWKYLMQWRLVIPTALLVGAALMGAMYVRDQRSHTQAMEAVVSEDTLREALDPEDAAAVDDAVLFSRELSIHKDYLDHSVLMHMDPFRMRALHIRYLITAENADIIPTCRQLYESYFTSNSIQSSVSAALSLSAEPEYVSELIRVEQTEHHGDALGGVVHVTIFLPEEIESRALLEGIDDQLQAYQSMLSPQVGAHSISRFSTEEAVRIDSDILAARNDFYSELNMLDDRVKSLVGSFSSEQTALYDYLMEENDAENGAADTIPEEKETPAPTLSLKYFLLGVILGAFLYALFMLLDAMLRPCVRLSSETEDMLGITTFGEIHEYRYESGFSVFRFDHHIYDLRYKKKLNTSRQTRQTAEILTGYFKRRGYRQASLVALDPIGARADNYLMEIIEKAEESDILLSSPLSISLEEEGALPDISGAKGIILVLFCDRTRYRDIDALISTSRDFDIPVYGTLFLDV